MEDFCICECVRVCMGVCVYVFLSSSLLIAKPVEGALVKEQLTPLRPLKVGESTEGLRCARREGRTTDKKNSEEKEGVGTRRMG